MLISELYLLIPDISLILLPVDIKIFKLQNINEIAQQPSVWVCASLCGALNAPANH